jgi:nucleotide-binding universal stress UspA family protein
MTFTKILASIRSTEGPSPVFAKALELAKEQQAKLMVYHCRESDRTKDHPERSLTATQMDMDTIKNRLESKTKRSFPESAWIESLAVKARKQGVETKWLVEEGRPGKRIVQLAEQWHADLIVIGRTRRGSLVDTLFGTVSDHVIHHASCSLLLVQ